MISLAREIRRYSSKLANFSAIQVPLAWHPSCHETNRPRNMFPGQPRFALCWNSLLHLVPDKRMLWFLQECVQRPDIEFAAYDRAVVVYTLIAFRRSIGIVPCCKPVFELISEGLNLARPRSAMTKVRLKMSIFCGLRSWWYPRKCRGRDSSINVILWIDWSADITISTCVHSWIRSCIEWGKFLFR